MWVIFSEIGSLFELEGRSMNFRQTSDIYHLKLMG